MTTITTYTQQDGSTVELRTNPGCAPMVFLNGVIQNPDDYYVVGHSVIFEKHKKIYWKQWFAWRPVQVHGRWTWFKTVYRYRTNDDYVHHDDWARYSYGNILDVLRKNNG